MSLRSPGVMTSAPGWKARSAFGTVIAQSATWRIRRRSRSPARITLRAERVGEVLHARRGEVPARRARPDGGALRLERAAVGRDLRPEVLAVAPVRTQQGRARRPRPAAAFAVTRFRRQLTGRPGALAP